MPENRKRLPARFYETANGRAPVRDWLLDLGDDDRRTMGKEIAKAEFGWPIGMPSCRAMGVGLFEIRGNLSDGKIGGFCLVSPTAAWCFCTGLSKKPKPRPRPTWVWR